MDHSNKDLQELVATGKTQGYLTYDQVNDYLPDEAVTPEKLDNLLIALEELGIELVNEAPEPAFFEDTPPKSPMLRPGASSGKRVPAKSAFGGRSAQKTCRS